MYLTLENIIVQILIAISLFLLFIWTINRFNRRFKYKTKVALISALVLTPIIYSGIIMLFIYSITYELKKDFDEKAWKNNNKKRYYMAQDIIDNKILIGKDTSEVKQMIGLPSNSREHNYWEYNMGEGSGGLGFMFHFLSLNIENGKIVSVEHNRFRD